MHGYGSGIAGQIRLIYPGAFKAFREDERSPEDKFGDFSVGRSGVSPFTAIYNAYGQMYYGTDRVQTDIEKLREAVESIFSELYLLDGVKLACPGVIGCGLAGGNEEEVKQMLREVSDDFGMDVYMYFFTP
jgi:hypothetical protein